LLETVALSGFTVSQPVLYVFGRAPEVFVLHRLHGAGVVLFACAVAFIPPVALSGAGLLAGVLGGVRVRRGAHALVVAGLMSLFVLQVTRRASPLAGPVLVVLSATLGGAAAVVINRAAAARLWIRVAAVAPVVFVAEFLLASPVAPLATADASKALSVAGQANSPVVFVMLDELPTMSLLDGRGGIDAARFPNLAALARDATWYRNYTAVGENTSTAIVAALDGRYPGLSNRAPTWEVFPDNLFRLTGAAYDMHVFETVTALCPPTACEGGASSPTGPRGVPSMLNEAADLYRQLVALRDPDKAPLTALLEELDTPGTEPVPVPSGAPADPSVPEMSDDVTQLREPRRVNDFIASFDDVSADGRPGFWFLHLVLPHHPYHLFPDGTEYALPAVTEQIPGLSMARWGESRWAALSARQRQLLQTRYTDRAVGEILDGLRAAGLYDDAVVIVTADHGVAFTAGDLFRGISDTNASQIAWVPLLVKAQNQTQGLVDDRNVEEVDVLATVADLIGLELPWPTDGISAAGTRRRDPRTKTFVRLPSLLQPQGAARIDLDARAGFDAMLEGWLTTAGSGDVDMGVLRSGPHGDMIGRSLTAFARAAPDRRVARVDARDAFRSVDTGGPLPAFVRGTLEGGREGETVVVALNGIIAGVSPVFGDASEHAAFTMLMPASLFRTGANDLELFALADTDRGIALAPLAAPD